MKKVLVTGGAGFIGSNLIKELQLREINVVSLDDYSTGSKDNHINGVNYINLDIENIEQIDEFGFDTCFHLAAQSRVQPSFDNPQESIRINITGTTKILEWARENSIKVIYAGSSSKHHNPCDSPYAMTKYIGEELCKLYRTSFNVDVEIARFYNVYGPGENTDEKFGNVIGIWKSKISKGEPLPIVGDGTQKRDFIHVFDIVDGLIKIASSKQKHKDAWELGTGISYSINQLFKYFQEKFNVDFYFIPNQKGNYPETLRENDDMLELLDWIPKDRLKDHIFDIEIQ